VEALARPHGGAHISPSSVLNVDATASFVFKGTIEPMLAEFGKRVTSLRDTGGMLQSIHREIAAVRKDFGELRNAKQQLEKMLADGMFAFTRKVDAKSFHAFCTILAEGDVSKAARTLEMGDSTLRDLLREWRGRGGAYERMLDVVRWRKRVGRTERVPLNDDVILGKAGSSDYPALLSEVLEGLVSMTESNWEELGRELAEMLRAEIGANVTCETWRRYSHTIVTTNPSVAATQMITFGKRRPLRSEVGMLLIKAQRSSVRNV
jgi:hypothetical protein